ncbi:MAG: hydantoinase B/oxoprolinase family protein [Rhodospirillaceae bacterium]|nr:hydantoinase B/oxoprolinase family protein [Rhodospirillaceae bacterium]
MTADDTLSRIRYPVLWNRLIAIVEEQARSLIKTAFSETVSEAGDLSAGVFDTKGRMVAQAITGTPGHVNSMAESVGYFLEKFPASTMEPGDHFITNDPWLSSGHLHDITVVSPAFHDGNVTALFACTCHQVDIGGLGQSPDGRSIYEEGLFIPIMRLARRGLWNEDLLELIRCNVRQPKPVEGDIKSYATCNHLGERRLAETLDEYPDVRFADLADFVINRSRTAMQDAIRALPDGTYRNVLTLDGYDQPVTLDAALVIGGDTITIDFDGSSPASKYGINLVYNYTLAYAVFGVRAAVAPEIPNNFGSLAPVRVVAPPGSILNVQKPRPVSARHIIGQFLPDVVLGCLAQVRGLEIPAEGAACLWGIQVRGGPEIGAASGNGRDDHARTFDLLSFNSGGSGARPGLDGLSAMAFPSGVRALPVEAVETRAPVVVWRKELRPDSGGAGRQRGGLGQTVEMGTRDGAPFALFAMYDRVDNPARGRDGGASGAAGLVTTSGGVRLRSKGKQTIESGDRIRVDLPGGGGHGHPHDRPVEVIAADLAEGYVTPDAAQRLYGVTIAADGSVRR